VSKRAGKAGDYCELMSNARRHPWRALDAASLNNSIYLKEDKTETIANL